MDESMAKLKKALSFEEYSNSTTREYAVNKLRGLMDFYYKRRYLTRPQQTLLDDILKKQSSTWKLASYRPGL